MKIIVLLKELFDTDSKMVLTAEGEIDSRGLRYTINPYDEYALEEAVLLKEQYGGEVIIYTLGREEAVPNIKGALAIGADRAVLIKAESKDSINTSRILADYIAAYDGDFDLILAGWVAVDDNNAQVPARISQIFGVPLVNVITELILLIENGMIICRRESENQQEIVEARIPAVAAVQKGINRPRYPTVQNILESNKKEIKICTPVEVGSVKGVSFNYRLPLKTKLGYRIDGTDPNKAVAELIAKMQEAKAL